jgi:hypothetical protein
MVRVEIKNFQSMVDEVIEIDGFSAVAGRSNIGKSAIVRAIKAALTGAPADSCVRHSTDCPRTVKGSKTCKCFCSVRIVGDGLDLLWEKGDSVNRYVHNSVEHTVVGRGTPEFLGPGFGLVGTGNGERELLQVADQFDPPFLMNKSGTAVADVLSDVAKLDQINVASRLVEKDRKEAASTRKVRERDISDIQLALDRYTDLDSVLLRVKDVSALEAKVDQLELQAARLSQFVESLTSVARGIKALSGVTQLVAPDVSQAVGLGAQIRKLSTLDKQLKDRMSSVSVLSKITDVGIPDLESFGQLGKGYKNLVRWAAQVGALKGFFERVKATESAQPPAIGPLKDLQTEFKRLVGWQSKVTSLASSEAALRQSLAAVSKEEEDVLAGFRAMGVCPTCKQGFQAPHQNQELTACLG